MKGKVLRDLLQGVLDSLKGDTLTGLITDGFEKDILWRFEPAPNRKYLVFVTYRRMGIDNGMDTLVRLDNNLHIALEQMDDKLFTPTPNKSAK
jgi:hypothetical protein